MSVPPSTKDEVKLKETPQPAVHIFVEGESTGVSDVSRSVKVCVHPLSLLLDGQDTLPVRPSLNLAAILHMHFSVPNNQPSARSLCKLHLTNSVQLCAVLFDIQTRFDVHSVVISVCRHKHSTAVRFSHM